MAVTLVYGPEHRKCAKPPLSWTNDRRHYINASKLIDAILLRQRKGKVVVVRDRFVYFPPICGKPLTIRLKGRRH